MQETKDIINYLLTDYNEKYHSPQFNLLLKININLSKHMSITLNKRQSECFMMIIDRDKENFDWFREELEEGGAL